MHSRRLVAVATIGLGLPSLLLSRPASAAAPALLPLLGGSLTISTPSSVTLKSGANNPVASLNGETVTGQLGATTVTDTTSPLAHVDSITMSSTAFTNGSATVPAADATGYSGMPTSTSGLLTAVILPTTTGQSLSGAGSTIMTATGVISTGFSVTYNPTVSIAIPGSAIAGTYSGTITQTVSSA